VQRFKHILRKFLKKSDSRDVSASSGGWEFSADGSLAPGFALDVDDSAANELSVKISGQISMENAGDVRNQLLATVKGRSVNKVVIDLENVDYFDSSGAAILMEVGESCTETSCSVELKNVPDRIRSFMDMVDLNRLKTGAILKPAPAPNLLVQIGGGVQDLGTNARDIITFIGATLVALIQDLAHPRKLKWDNLWKIVERSGSDAMPIVAILSFLMGAIMAFQSAIQLRKFGANIFVADLVSLSICLEMGPLLTALIVAGRSGAAYAAHIGTMQVNEEIDALRVMAIDPIRYLVSPRVLAVAFVTPCLVLFGDLMGILGGCVVAAVSVDLTPVAYFNEVNKVLEIVDVLKGLIKSFVFGVEVAMIGCLRGFQVRGGAESVGSATTSAVVTGIFVITVTDALFSVLYYYLPAFWNM
jgi:phospholipid/cholesterol/gamma-HCH transport system permease protein